MADLAVEISKTAVKLVAEKVKSAIKEEEEQWQIVERDLMFITGEFEMMQSFLDTTQGERIRNHVVRTWVRQVRDLSYDVEDCIDFVLHLDTNQHPWWLRLWPSCWPWPPRAAALPVDEAVSDITLLKARVVDVSERNMRYNLISDTGSKPTALVEPTTAAAAPSPSAIAHTTSAPNVLLTSDAPNSKPAISDLADVINLNDEDLRVISVHATDGEGLGTISVLRKLFYEDKKILRNFARRAWVKLLHPFNPHEFIRNVVAQFLTNIPGQDQNVIIGIHVMKQLEKINIVDIFVKEVDTQRYLIVLEGVTSMEQWDAIRTYLPNKRNKSRIIMSTHHAGIARLCTRKPYRVSLLKQPSLADHSAHVFHSCHDDENGLQNQEQAVNSAGLFGRDKEIDELLQLIQRRHHISVWGPPGIGKTTVMKAVYERGSDFIRAWANVSDPFNGEDVSQDIQEGLRDCLRAASQAANDGLANPIAGSKQTVKARRASIFSQLFFGVNRPRRSLVVIEDLKSNEEWDFINDNITSNMKGGSCVVVITTNESIARYCAQGSNSTVYRVKGLEADTALRLFKEKKGLQNQEQAVNSAGLFRPDEEIDELLQLLQRRRHISVWGPPGIGKALMKAVYERGRSDFIRAWANVSDPFNGEDVCQDIKKGLRASLRAARLILRGLANPIAGSKQTLKAHRRVAKDPKRPSIIRRLFLEVDRSLVVIDDLKSKEEWDFINDNITSNMQGESCVVVITANESIATYCAQGSNSTVYRVKGLEADTALRLFKEKALTGDDGSPSSAEGLRRLISMCSGLPKFITTLARHVANKTHIHDREVEMRLLSDNFMPEMHNITSFGWLKGVFSWLHSSFEASPQLVKKCIFYLSIFPRGSIIRRRRLVRRWAAEGFSESGSTHRNSLQEAELLINKLIDLGVMQAIPFPAPAAGGGATRNKWSLSSFQVNSLFLDYIISRQMEERTFLPLEVSILKGAVASNMTKAMAIGRHLAIRSSWERDEFDFNNMDLSRLRSLTLSGEWQPFFITDKMRVLRVLDLEGTSGIDVQSNSFKQIGFLLPRLKLLSLRGCEQVCSLPDSLGELRQLQTLDIRGTSIAKLPQNIVELHKLQNICAGKMHLGRYNEASSPRRTWGSIVREQLSSLLSKFQAHPEAAQGGSGDDDGGCSSGVVVPIGIGKLEALRTLSVVNANASTSGGEFVLRDVNKLTKLSKLGVWGLAKANSRDFWTLVADHRHMESLSVWGGEFPPKHVGFPPNLTKLTLDMLPSYVLTSQGLELLGALEKLRTLRLLVGSAIAGGTLLLGTFGQLKVLLIACNGSFNVEFPEDGMKELEQLTLETEESLTIKDGMEQLGKLKRLRTLCLRFHKYVATDTTELMQFGNNDGSFGQLKVLEVVSMSCLLVKFPEGAMKELEQLTLQADNSITLDGLNHLGMLKRLHTMCLSFGHTDEGRDLQFGDKHWIWYYLYTSSPSDDPFSSLKVLELACSTSLPRLKFAEGALKNLMKLTLRMATLFTAEQMKELGKLEKLRTLCLDIDNCQQPEGQLQFGEKQKDVGVGASSSRSTPPEQFGKLKVLEIIYRSRLLVTFSEKKMKLEQLKLHFFTESSSSEESSNIDFLGLDHHHLPLLSHVWIKASSAYSNVLKQAMECRLVGHKNKPVVRNLD